MPPLRQAGCDAGEAPLLPVRRSSLVDAPELRYYCRVCRSENVMDLPHWHWGEVRSHSASGRARMGRVSGDKPPDGVTSNDMDAGLCSP